jgi:hypothetical protein
MITDILVGDGGRIVMVGLVSGLWAGCPKNHGSIRSRGKAFHLFSETSRSALSPLIGESSRSVKLSTPDL